MDIRKVQITGGSSYVVTLPKEWAKSNNLKKNDPLGLIQQPDGNLLVTSKITGSQVQRDKVFEIEKPTEPEYIKRQLIGAYIAGFNNIIVKTSIHQAPMVRATVREYTHMTIGQEIVEETKTSITIKDLLNPSEMPLEKTIRRMQMITKSMHEEVFMALSQGKKSLAEECIGRDSEVDRLHWLVARQYNLILNNVSLTEKMKVTIETATIFYLISRIMERIGDHAVRIAQNVPQLISAKISKKTIRAIGETTDLALEMYSDSLTGLFKENLKISNRNISRLDELEASCNELNSLALRYKGLSGLSVGKIANSLRRVGEYSVNISENVINHLIGQP